MNILFIDSVHTELVVALTEDKTVKNVAVNAEQRQHDKNINKMIKEVLGSTRPDIAAVNIGPGSWTGVRVGVTAAKAYSFALNLPIWSIVSPDRAEQEKNINKTLSLRDKNINEYIVQALSSPHKITDAKTCLPYYSADFIVNK